MNATKPPYYRFKAGTVTRTFYVERYDFQTVADCQKFLAWVNAQDSAKIKEVVAQAQTITIYWNKGWY